LGFVLLGDLLVEGERALEESIGRREEAMEGEAQVTEEDMRLDLIPVVNLEEDIGPKGRRGRELKEAEEWKRREREGRRICANHLILINDRRRGGNGARGEGGKGIQGAGQGGWNGGYSGLALVSTSKVKRSFHTGSRVTLIVLLLNRKR